MASHIDNAVGVAVVSHSNLVNAKVVKDLEGLFAERPVWSAHALQERVRSPKGFIDSEQLAKVAYLFRSGTLLVALKGVPELAAVPVRWSLTATGTAALVLRFSGGGDADVQLVSFQNVQQPGSVRVSAGPFAPLWIRRGYDPRTDPRSCQYQRVVYRNPTSL